MADVELLKNPEIVIVGAGPVGLALANGLGLDGRKVLVLEKNSRLSEHSKAATLWSRTQEVIDRMGLLPAFEKESLVRDHLEFTNADAVPPKKIVDIPLYELKNETRFPRLLLIPQNVTERVFYECLRVHPNVRVEFSAAVTAIDDHATGATVSYSKDGLENHVEALYVVGCDGPHSTVRATMGVHLQGETYAIKAGLADVILGDRLREYAFPRLTAKGVLCVALQVSTDLWRLIFIERANENYDLDQQTRIAVENLFGQADYTLVWKSDFKLHRRTSEVFGKGHLVLAGDAAHLNSPIGGQGMNSGIQDTEALRKALNDALELGSPQPVLDYAIKRKTQIEAGVNRYTGFMTSLLAFQNARFAPRLLVALGLAFKIPAIRHAFLKRAAMLT